MSEQYYENAEPENINELKEEDSKNDTPVMMEAGQENQSGHAEEAAPEKKHGKKARKPMTTGRRWASVVAMGLVFGLVAGGTMFGVSGRKSLIRSGSFFRKSSCRSVELSISMERSALKIRKTTHPQQIPAESAAKNVMISFMRHSPYTSIVVILRMIRNPVTTSPMTTTMITSPSGELKNASTISGEIFAIAASSRNGIAPMM